MSDLRQILFRYLEFRFLVQKLKHFKFSVVETTKLVQKIGCMDVARSNVFEGAFILADGKSIFEFFLSNFFLKLISLEMNSGKRQQESHLFFD
jgi:hypothetical protein